MELFGGGLQLRSSRVSGEEQGAPAREERPAAGDGAGDGTSSLSSVFSSPAPDGVGIIVRVQMGHGHCERSLQGRGPQESGGHWAAETSALRGRSFCSSFQVRSWGEAPRRDQAVTGGEIKGAFQGKDLMREEETKKRE